MTKKQKIELLKFIDQIKQETKEGPGRTSGLTWEMLARIKALLYEGQFQKYVYQSLGVPKTTWDTWAKNGRKIAKDIQEKNRKFESLKQPDQRYLALAAYLYEGKARAIIKHIRIIADAGKEDYKASIWFLKMQDRELFGDKIQADVKVDMNMKTIADKYRERKKKNAGSAGK